MRDSFRALVLVALTTLSTTLPGLVEIQRLSADELRHRFALPKTCDPAITAVGRGARNGKIDVVITCKNQPPSAGAPGPDSGPPRS